MRFLMTILLALVAAAIPFIASAQYDTHEIIQLHKEAIRPEALEGVTLVQWKGTEARPKGKVKQSYTLFQDNERNWACFREHGSTKSRDIFIGMQGWSVAQSGQREYVRPMRMERPEPAARMAHFSSPVLGEETREYQIEYQGLKLQGREQYHEFRIEAKNNDGFMVYLNPESFLIHHIRDWRVLDGELQSVEIIFDDYREVRDGAYLPFSWTYIQQGEVIASYQFDEIILNPALEQDPFVMPIQEERSTDARDQADR